MKKIISVILALAMLTLAFALTSCGAKGKTLDEIKSKGELVVATSPDFPPFEDIGTGEGSVDGVVGIEVEILKIITEKLGVKLVIKSMDFDAVLAGVSAAKYDLGASGVSIRPDRQKNMLFTDPYCSASQVIVVKDGSSIKSKADLAGKKVSVQTATTAETLCTELGYTVSAYASNSDAETAMATGKVDAWVIDDLTAGEMVAAYNADHDEKIVILGEPLSSDETYAFIAAFGSETLIGEMNKIIAGLISDGTIGKIFAKYDAPYFAPAK